MVQSDMIGPVQKASSHVHGRVPFGACSGPAHKNILLPGTMLK